jgi:hypothetical protein
MACDNQARLRFVIASHNNESASTDVNEKRYGSALNHQHEGLCMNTCARFIILLAVTMMATAISTAQDHSVDLEALIDAIQHSERKLINLSVSGKSVTERYDSSSREWVYDGESEFTAWYTGMPGSKAKVEYHKRVLPWTGGSKPFSEKSEIYAYTGKVGQTLILSANGQSFLRGIIRPDRPKTLSFDAAATGWNTSLYGAIDSEKRSLSALLRQWQKTGVSAEYATIDQTQCIRVSLTQGKLTRSWYLDPSREYALRRVEVSLYDVLYRRVSVQQITAVAAGVFYPSRVLIERFDLAAGRDDAGDPTATGRTRWELTDATANADNWSDDVFQIEWPAGCVINDRISGTVIHVSAPPRDLDRLITKQVADAKVALEDVPADADAQSTDVVDSARVGHASQETASTATSNGIRHHVPVTIAGAGVVIIAVLAAVITWSIVRRRGGKAGMVLLCVSIATSALCTEGVLLETAGIDKIENCGLNALVFVLEYYDMTPAIEEIASDLNLGVHHDRALSLAEIQEAIDHYGLHTGGFKDVTPASLAENLKNGRHLCVLHLQRNPSRPGHFVVIVATRGDQLYLVDPGVKADWLPREKLQGLMSGLCLFVSERQDENADANGTPYDLTRSQLLYSAGRIRPGMGDVVVCIPVSNTTSKPMSIRRWSGTCGCIKAVELVNEEQPIEAIPAQGTGVLRITFDRSSFGQGTVTRSIALRLQDEIERTTVVEVTAEVPPSTDVSPFTWVPSAIDYGVFRDESVLARPVDVCLFLPIGVNVDSVETSTEDIEVTPRGQVKDARLERVTWRYKINVHVTADEFREEVRFLITSKDMREIQIPISGRYAGKGDGDDVPAPRDSPE